MEILTGAGFEDTPEWDAIVMGTSGNPELTKQMLEEERQRKQKGISPMAGTYEEYAAIWQQLLQLNGGDPALAMMMMDRLNDVQGGGDPEVITQRPRPMPPELTGPPPRPRMQNPMPIPRPGGYGGRDNYDPLSSIRTGDTTPATQPMPRPPGMQGGLGTQTPFDVPPPGSAPPPGRLVGEDRLPPAPLLSGPPGRLVGEDRLPPPTTPVVAAQPPVPTVSSSGGGGGGGEMVGPPMPRPNQQQMDGGIWAALRQAFANNAGNNERLALERMIASIGGGDRG